MYIAGEGVKRDFQQALHWFLKSADQGDVPAAYNVGLIYAKAMGVPKDEVKGYMWLLVAAHFEYVPSQNALKTLDSKLSPSKVAEARRRAEQWFKNHPDVKPILQ
jgi:TPR repeat protein